MLAVAAAIITVGLGLIYAGSSGKLANGTRIAGIDVGGLTPSAARRLLERRSESVSRVPVVFTAGAKRFSLTPLVTLLAEPEQKIDYVVDRMLPAGGVRRGYRWRCASTSPNSRCS